MFMSTKIFSCLCLCLWSRNSIHDIEHLLGLICMNSCPSFYEIVHNSKNWVSMPCVTLLHRAQFKFMNTLKRKMVDLQLRNLVMEIPTLTIEDWRECNFRNLITYEQYCHDVELVCLKGIVENCIWWWISSLLSIQGRSLRQPI